MPPTQITLVAHTHWDREWYEPFEVFRAHLVEALDQALDDLERDERLHFTLDGQVAMVDDYLEVRPKHEPRITALVRAGRLHIGPWYTQADTLLVDGEGIIRNLARGIRRAEELGGAMRVGYIPDQFGHAAQLPQWLSLFGIDSAVLWRGVGPDEPPHSFRWQGPDGSAVTALWLRDGYGSGRRIPSDPTGFADAVDRTLERLGGWLGELPLLVPIGDDHVKLAAWLPAAAEALAARHPGMNVQIGGYHHHLPHALKSDHTVRGELRSPAFAPVLANVASARVWEKQAAHRAMQLLLRYAEPLNAWVGRVGGTPSDHLLERAWRQLLYNQAHDSAAGCGVDAAHEDIKGRYRWAEQLAGVARDQALAQLRLELRLAKADQPIEHAIAFSPTTNGSLAVQADVARSLEGELVGVGPDGVARPTQVLSQAVEPPIFEGEFSPEELGQYLGGLDPATPLFGKYLTGIVAKEEPNGLVRMDVGLGETQVSPKLLAADQLRVGSLLKTAKRFKIVLHGCGVTRPMLVQGGPSEEAAFVPIAVRPGTPDASVPVVSVGEVGMSCGSLTVSVNPDGTVLIRDPELPLGAVRVNDLVDEGDRGDLYHFDGAGEPIRCHTTRVTIAERGPVRGRLHIEQELAIPLHLHEDRKQRIANSRPTRIVTEVTLIAGQRTVELVTTLHNESSDHRLRVLCHAPFEADRIDAEHGMTIIDRPLDSGRSLGAGTERAAPTGQHHLFVDVTDGKAGMALMSRGLIEHEVVRRGGGDASGTHIALTLLRSVGWLSRGDLSTIDHAAGPMVPTPAAQELGAHRFEYAVLLHRGDWQAGRVLADARRYAAPPVTVKLKGERTVPSGTGLVKVKPESVIVTALQHSAAHPRQLSVRLLNESPQSAEVELAAAFAIESATVVDPLEVPVAGAVARIAAGVAHLRLRPWQLVTLLLR